MTLEKTEINAVEKIGEYVDLKRSGQNYKGLCPFHTEKTPSFIVNPSRQRYHCFGCGASGDAIDFIQQLRGLSFKEALRYLGIDQGPLSREQRATIERQQQKRELVREFRRWVDDRHRELSLKYRTLYRAKVLAKSEEEYRRNPYACMESLWEHYLDVLEEGTDKEKYALYQSYQQAGANDMSSQKRRTEVDV